MIDVYLSGWKYALGGVVHFFSLPILLTTLFSPWRRLSQDQEIVGFNLERWFEKESFNLISRGIGFFVRTFLFLFGFTALSTVFLGGLVGFVLWLAIPFFPLVYFATHDPGYKRLLSSLSPHTFFSTRPGKFVLTHLGLSESDLAFDTQVVSPDSSPKSLSVFMAGILAQNPYNRDRLRKLGVDLADLQLAAGWWDYLHLKDSAPRHYTRAGIGLELMTGYTPRLNQYVTDLSAPQKFSHHLVGRTDTVSRIERALVSHESVVLVGPPGVGKKTVVLEFARRAQGGELNPKLLYQRVLEFDYNFLLSGSTDLNQKKALLAELLSEAADAGNVILVIKDLHRLTRSDIEGLDFTDLFERHLEKDKLKIIAISSDVDYERFLVTNSKLRKYFSAVTANVPTKEEATRIVMESASDWEARRQITVTVPAVRAIITGSDRFITDIPFPQKALEILDHAVAFAEKEGHTILTPDVVNAVISEITGISLAHLTDRQKNLLANLESVIHQHISGQDTAVTLISRSLRAANLGLKDAGRPVGSFLFLGPTGVGKTQTAKALAEIYYGSQKEILRFDMAEYAGNGGLNRLIGSPDKSQPGSLTTAIKNHPASLLLLDEIEKAPPEVYNLFLSLLDEGSITDAFDKKINCQHLFVIATSNAGSTYIRDRVRAGSMGGQLQKEVLEYIQHKGLFSPEFLNRFDGVVVFEPLSKRQLTQIASLMLKDLQVSLERKNIHFEITPDLTEAVAEDSFDPEFGARPMRRLIDLTLGDIISRSMLSGDLSDGSKFQLVPDKTEGYKIKKL
ncbi:MAG: AAA family ATPase [Patescibacteria group bacterium]